MRGGGGGGEKSRDGKNLELLMGRSVSRPTITSGGKKPDLMNSDRLPKTLVALRPNRETALFIKPNHPGNTTVADRSSAGCSNHSTKIHTQPSLHFSYRILVVSYRSGPSLCIAVMLYYRCRTIQSLLLILIF